MSLTKMIYKHGEELVLGDVVLGILDSGTGNAKTAICLKIAPCDTIYIIIWFLVGGKVLKTYIHKQARYKTI